LPSARRPRLVPNLCGRLRSDPAISSIKTSTMITSSNSPLRGSGTLYHLNGVLVHTMDGSGLSRVRTELEGRRILTTIPPHPVQTNPQPPPHRDFGNALVPAHGQVHIPTSPVRVDPCCRLRCLHQQVAQQGSSCLRFVSVAVTFDVLRQRCEGAACVSCSIVMRIISKVMAST
jgi:hypothetical protein